MFSYWSQSRSCIISEEAIKLTTTARAEKLWKKYTDKICDQILKEKKVIL